MPTQHETAIRVFGILQGVLLLAIAVGLYVHWRRRKDHEELMDRLDELRVQMQISRLKAEHGTKAEYTPKAGSQKKPGARHGPKPELESAFPSWGKETPAHEILGVKADAAPAAIEAAYKAALKRYHPDRFAHWGAAYQNRAHYVVLMIKEARDRLLGKKGR